MTQFSPWGYGGGRGHGTNYQTPYTAMMYRVTNADKSDDIAGRYAEFFASSPQERAHAALCGSKIPDFESRTPQSLQAHKNWKVSLSIANALRVTLLPYYGATCKTPIQLQTPRVLEDQTVQEDEVGEWDMSKNYGSKVPCYGYARWGIPGKWSSPVRVNGTFKCGDRDAGFYPDPAWGKSKTCSCLANPQPDATSTSETTYENGIELKFAFKRSSIFGCFRLYALVLRPHTSPAMYRDVVVSYSDDGGKNWIRAPQTFAGAFTKFDALSPFSETTPPQSSARRNEVILASASGGCFVFLAVVAAVFYATQRNKRARESSADDDDLFAKVGKPQLEMKINPMML